MGYASQFCVDERDQLLERTLLPLTPSHQQLRNPL